MLYMVLSALPSVSLCVLSFFLSPHLLFFSMLSIQQDIVQKLTPSNYTEKGIASGFDIILSIS